MTTESVDIQYLTTAELAGLLRTRALSPVGVTRAQLELSLIHISTRRAGTIDRRKR